MATDFPVLATQVPVIPGWATSHDESTGTYRAEEPDPRTPFQLAHGCVLVVEASSAEELVARCLAQWTLAELLAVAETAGPAREAGIRAAWHAYGVLMSRWEPSVERDFIVGCYDDGTFYATHLVDPSVRVSAPDREMLADYCRMARLGLAFRRVGSTPREART